MATINVTAAKSSPSTEVPSGFIPLVRNDNGPQISLVLTESVDGVPFDLTDGVVTIHFRREGSETVLFSRQAVIPTGSAAAGRAYLIFADGDLDIASGRYEGEVEMVLADGFRQTVYQTLKFFLREDFA